MMTLDIAVFLRARYDERESVARSAGAARWIASSEETIDGDNVYFTLSAVGEDDTFAHTYGAEADKVQHIADNDPEFVLADVKAKRQIVDMWARWADGFGTFGRAGEAMEATLSLLALPYASHPEFREEWK